VVEAVLASLEFFLLALVGVSLLTAAFGALVVAFGRRSHQVFALFMLVVGGDFLLSSLSRATLDLAGRLSFYFTLAVPFAGLLFALTYAAQTSGFLGGTRTARYRLAAAAILVAGLAAEVVYLTDHDTYVRSVRDAAGDVYRDGVLALSTHAAPLVFAMVALLFMLDRARSPHGPTRRAKLLIALGFILHPAYRSAFLLTNLLNGLVRDGPTANPGWADPTFVAASAIQAATLILVVAVGVLLVRDRRRAPVPQHGMAGFAPAGAVALAVSTGVGAFLLLAFVQTWGGVPLLMARDLQLIWFLTLPVFLGYGLLRFQVFGLDLRVKDAVRVGSFALVFVVVFAFVFVGGGRFLSDIPAFALAAASTAAAGTAWRPVNRFSRRVANAFFPRVQKEEGYATIRKFELYQAALEEAVAQGDAAAAKDRHLTALRRRLGVTEQEHHFLVYLAVAQKRVSTAPQRQQRFRIERELGRGTHGRALLAHDEVLDRRVVLKQAISGWLHDPMVRDRFLTEARTAARIQHPNVVTLYEILADEDPPVLVLEHVDGRSLDQLMGRRPMVVAEATGIVLDILAGLRAIHDAGLVHRDLKPANVMLTRSGTAKIGDFGVAAPPQAADGTQTVALAPAEGSPAYMSPEQAEGGPVDHRSDIYAVGVILHEMLTGRHYLGDTREPEYRLRQRILDTPPKVDQPHVPKPLAKLLRQLLARDPRGRPATAEQAARLLERAAAKARPSAGRAASRPVPATPRHA
jgi:tRNA A-37 threonylcarbamoyl transferase component Bud32